MQSRGALRVARPQWPRRASQAPKVSSLRLGCPGAALRLWQHAQSSSRISSSLTIKCSTGPTNKLQIDGFLSEPFAQNVTCVGSQPFARRRCVGDVHLDQCQDVSVDNALIPPEPSRRVVAEDEQRAAAEPPDEVVCRLQKLHVLNRRSMGPWRLRCKAREAGGAR